MVKEWQTHSDNPPVLVVNQPAGHVENNETLEEAVIREVLEETGWRVHPKNIIGSYSFTPYHGADTFHRICFACHAISKETNELDPDIQESIWMTKEQIMAHPLRSPLVRQCIEDYENAPTFPLTLINNRFIKPL